MQKYNYNHERVCEKRKCRKNVGKGKPPPNLPPHWAPPPLGEESVKSAESWEGWECWEDWECWESLIIIL